MIDDIRELSDEDFERAIPRKQRERIIRGQIEPGKDIVALRRFAGRAECSRRPVQADAARFSRNTRG